MFNIGRDLLRLGLVLVFIAFLGGLGVMGAIWWLS